MINLKKTEVGDKLGSLHNLLPAPTGFFYLAYSLTLKMEETHSSKWHSITTQKTVLSNYLYNLLHLHDIQTPKFKY
jgi:hypothetical protein